MNRMIPEKAILFMDILCNFYRLAITLGIVDLTMIIGYFLTIGVGKALRMRHETPRWVLASVATVTTC